MNLCRTRRDGFMQRRLHSGGPCPLEPTRMRIPIPITFQLDDCIMWNIEIMSKPRLEIVSPARTTSCNSKHSIAVTDGRFPSPPQVAGQLMPRVDGHVFHDSRKGGTISRNRLKGVPPMKGSHSHKHVHSHEHRHGSAQAHKHEHEHEHAHAHEHGTDTERHDHQHTGEHGEHQHQHSL